MLHVTTCAKVLLRATHIYQYLLGFKPSLFPLGPPSPPFGVTVDEISPTDVLVRWQQPTILGFPTLSTYTVVLILSETGEEVNNATVPFPETAVNFTNLMLFTEYEVTVTASSENFTSNASAPAIFTTPAIGMRSDLFS